MRNFFLILLALAVASLGIGACSGDEKRPDTGGYSGENGLGGGPAGTCDEGEQRACGYKVDQGDGVVTCFMGTQACASDGTWGDCENGDFVDMPDDNNGDTKESHGWFKPLILTSQTAVECNPADLCDPDCWEVPEPSPTFTGGLQIQESVLCDPADTTPLAECSAGAGCEHSLCTTGVGLTASACGTCAQKVAASGTVPTCFGSSGSWTSACIAKAYELCLNAPPPIGLCEFGIFSETTLVMADRPGMGNGTVGARGNLEFGTDSPGKFPTKLIVTGDVWIRSPGSGTATFSGGIWATGSVGFQSASTIWNGNVRAGEGVYINGGNTFPGSVYTSSDYINSISGSDSPKSYNISGQSGGQITGTAYASSTAEIDTPMGGFSAPNKQVNPFSALTAANITAPTAVPSLPAPCASGTCPGGTNQSRTTSGDLSLSANNYGAVSLSNGARLVLSTSGTYSMKSLIMDGNGGLKLGATGTYYVIVEGAMKFGGSGAKVVDAANATLTDPTRLIVYVGSSGSPAFELGDTATFTGVLAVPNGSFKSNNTGAVRGAVWAAGFTTGPDFTLTQISKTQCEGLALSGTTAPTPPAATCTSLNSGAVTATPAVPSSSTEPCRWGADCQNNQRCVDVESRVGTAACSQFQKCVASGTSWGGPSALPCKDDPCVARIIANVSGCGTNWGATCVNAVQTWCDATCGATSTARSGTCVDNTGYSSEPGCTGYDLALGYACTRTAVPVCNHGSANFSGAVKVGFWNVTDRQFATLPSAAPDATSRDGTCTQTLNIPAGSCVNMNLNSTTCTPTTALAAGTNYTLMVDPDATGLLSECGTVNNTNRRVDNWSWHDKDFTCVSNPDYTEYEYIADCPDDQYPRWKYLKWVTDNNASSNVKFYAKVAKDLASLSAPSYTLLATNTADCTETAANMLTSTCSVGLTSALGLTSPQGQALSVRVEKTNSPIVTKWEVSYTCDYDQ